MKVFLLCGARLSHETSQQQEEIGWYYYYAHFKDEDDETQVFWVGSQDHTADQ